MYVPLTNLANRVWYTRSRIKYQLKNSILSNFVIVINCQLKRMLVECCLAIYPTVITFVPTCPAIQPNF